LTDHEPEQALAEAISAKWDSRDRVRTHLEQAADVIEELRESSTTFHCSRYDPNCTNRCCAIR
jgi:hypothetical protein